MLRAQSEIAPVGVTAAHSAGFAFAIVVSVTTRRDGASWYQSSKLYATPGKDENTIVTPGTTAPAAAAAAMTASS